MINSLGFPETIISKEIERTSILFSILAIRENFDVNFFGSFQKRDVRKRNTHKKLLLGSMKIISVELLLLHIRVGYKTHIHFNFTTI